MYKRQVLQQHASTLQVSLWAATPADYQAATHDDNNNCFGHVCGTIVQAAERNITVHVSVLPQYAAAARELALSLGAQHVNVIDGKS